MMSLPVWLPVPMFLRGDLCPGGISVWGVSVRGGLSPGRVSVQGGLCREIPPESERRAVRILLECFLVSQCLLFCISGRKLRIEVIAVKPREVRGDDEFS